jgi:hypothetical protein
LTSSASFSSTRRMVLLKFSFFNSLILFSITN